MGEISPTELARRLEAEVDLTITPQAIMNYLSSTSVPKSDVLYGIAKFFNRPMGWFFGEESVNQDETPQPLADLLSRAKDVLTSGNSIAADALEKNINYFAHAVAVENGMSKMQEDIDLLKSQLARVIGNASAKGIPWVEEGRPESKKDKVA